MRFPGSRKHIGIGTMVMVDAGQRQPQALGVRTKRLRPKVGEPEMKTTTLRTPESQSDGSESSAIKMDCITLYAYFFSEWNICFGLE
jgi:hypothetical protein